MVFRKTAGTSLREYVLQHVTAPRLVPSRCFVAPCCGLVRASPHERVVAPAQIIKADGSMDIGVPVAISQSNSARSRALDRWVRTGSTPRRSSSMHSHRSPTVARPCTQMVVLTSPATTPDSKQYREAYQRVFYYVTTVNLIVAAVIVFMYARAGVSSAPVRGGGRGPRLIWSLVGAWRCLTLSFGGPSRFALVAVSGYHHTAASPGRSVASQRWNARVCRFVCGW